MAVGQFQGGDYGKFKDAVNTVVTKGLSENDLVYAKPFIEELAKLGNKVTP